MKSAFSLLILCSVLSASWTLTACAQLNNKESGPAPNSSAASKIAAVPPAEPQTPPPAEPIGVQRGSILLVYPRAEKNNKIDCASTFIVGAVKAGQGLNCNGQPMQVNADGYFAHAVKLKYGINDFVLSVPGNESDSMKVEVLRPAPKAPLAPTTFNILPESLEPREDFGISAGDIIQFAARGTPGCQMSVEFGGHKIPLRQPVTKAGRAPSVNLGLDTAFGVSYQKSPAVRDLYVGIYKVQAQDNWDSAAVTFVLQKGKKQIKAKAKGKVTVVKQPALLKTAHANCIVRLGPGAARTTPLPEDVRMMADGFKGEWWRIDLCPGKHVWINKEDMSADDESTALLQSRVSTVNLGTDDYGACVSIPLTQKLPYQIEHDLNGKKLTLHIFGATADTDFVTADPQKPADSACARLIDYLTFKQKGDLHYVLCLQLKNKQQWGYWAEYKDSTLVLHVKKAPAIDLAKGNLSGAIICVDPGHGGKEIGSIGCSGVKEASVNFAIADKLREELEALGARVVMTRTGDTFIGLQERVDVAIANNADLLISVHNNALPDGRDPLTEHGTSSYWYHGQSIELARYAQKQLVQATGLKDFGSRFQNLALCRPTHMPAFLMEIAFMINPDELSNLLNPRFQQTTAKSIAGSIRNFMVGKVKEQTQSNPDE